MFRKRSKNKDKGGANVAVEAKKKDNSTDQITTLFGEGSQMEGNVSSDSSARIEGLLKGTARVKQVLIIGEKGTVKGDVFANHLVVFGKVEGKVEATIVDVKHSGNVVGDIKTETLLFEQGGIFNGNCVMQKAGDFSGASAGAGNSSTTQKKPEPNNKEENKPQQPQPQQQRK